MRCNIKVAYRNGVFLTERRLPTQSAKDSRLCIDWFTEWMRQCDNVLKASGEETERSGRLTKRDSRNVERAARFDARGWVRAECVDAIDEDGEAHVLCRVSTDNPNRCGEETGIPGALHDTAKMAADMVVHLVEDIARRKAPNARRLVRFEKSRVFEEARASESEHWRRKRVEAMRAADGTVCPSLLDDGTCKAGAACRCVKCRAGVCADAEDVE